MPESSQTRTRWKIPEPRGSIKPVMDSLRNSYLWCRIGVCGVATLILWIAFMGWSSPFPYRVRQSPANRLLARVPFEYIDVKATNDAKALARGLALCYYHNTKGPLENLQQALRDQIFELKSKTFDKLQRGAWMAFYGDASGDTKTAESEATEASLEKFKKALEKDDKLEVVQRVLQNAFFDFERNGLLISLEHQYTQGNMQEIYVFTDSPENARRVDVSKVRIEEIRDELHRRIRDEFDEVSDVISDPEFVADRVFQWCSSKLPTTLTWDQPLSRRKAEKGVDALPPTYKQFQPGDLLEIAKPQTTEAALAPCAAFSKRTTFNSCGPSMRHTSAANRSRQEFFARSRSLE